MLFKQKTKVFLDTSTLLLLGEGVDIFTLSKEAMEEPYELCMHPTVLKEVEGLMQERSRRGQGAKLAYVIAKQKALKTVGGSSHTHPDDALVEVARPKSTVIATQDKELGKRVRKKGVRTMRFYKGRFHLQT